MAKPTKFYGQCPATYAGHRCGLDEKHKGLHLTVYREGVLFKFKKGDD